MSNEWTLPWDLGSCKECGEALCCNDWLSTETVSETRQGATLERSPRSIQLLINPSTCVNCSLNRPWVKTRMKYASFYHSYTRPYRLLHHSSCCCGRSTCEAPLLTTVTLPDFHLVVEGRPETSVERLPPPEQLRVTVGAKAVYRGCLGR